MADFPTLKDMGINNPGQIDRYSVQHVNETDVLRIVYRRKKGSVLPDSRKYRFTRKGKPTVVDSGTRKTELIYEISPILEKALAELSQVVRIRKDRKAKLAVISDEVSRLEEETASRIAYIRELIEELE